MEWVHILFVKFKISVHLKSVKLLHSEHWFNLYMYVPTAKKLHRDVKHRDISCEMSESTKLLHSKTFHFTASGEKHRDISYEMSEPTRLLHSITFHFVTLGVKHRDIFYEMRSDQGFRHRMELPDYRNHFQLFTDINYFILLHHIYDHGWSNHQHSSTNRIPS